MHEYSIVAELVEKVGAIARERRAKTVRRLSVRIGELSGVETQLLETAYRMFRERTVCAEAELTILPVVARWVCSECRQPVKKGAILRCPVCGQPARLLEGDEIILDRVEMEVA
jgi:hydrogenase nickel insertion protein HypA